MIGQLRLPLGVVQNLIIDGQKYMVPMATEEPSVVAAANHGASIFVKNGGVSTVSHRDGIYGQIVLKVDEQFSLANFKNLPAWLVMVVVLALFRLDNKVI